MENILEANFATVGGKIKIFLTAKNNNALGIEVLKTVRTGATIETVADITQVVGVPIPEGSIIITEE